VLLNEISLLLALLVKSSWQPLDKYTIVPQSSFSSLSNDEQFWIVLCSIHWTLDRPYLKQEFGNDYHFRAERGKYQVLLSSEAKNALETRMKRIAVVWPIQHASKWDATQGSSLVRMVRVLKRSLRETGLVCLKMQIR